MAAVVTTSTPTGQTTTTTPLTNTTPLTTTALLTTATTPNVITSQVVAPTTVPATTQLVTSVVSVSNINGTPMPPSTVIITRITTPTQVPSNAPPQSTTSSSAAATSAGSLNPNNPNKSTSQDGLSPAGKTAIAVVIPIVVIALLILAGLFLWRRRKQRKDAEEERRKEMEAYGFNPNHDPTLPAVGGGATDSEMGEDQSGGYRGWGNTSNATRKASTTLSSNQQLSDHGYSPGSPTQASDGHSGDPLVAGAAVAGGAAAGGHHRRQSTMDSDTMGPMGAAPVAGSGRADMRRGPSNASSHYSIGDHSNHSNEAPVPVSQDYYTDNAYFTPGPYESNYGGGAAQDARQPVLRENPARRNTRIQEANVFPQQGSTGIAQNF
ncbi:hypothetical protein EJ08DRAFT_168309 [Tothia fuscella]|uniref:Uncharacterized protein n=1 Tax=Tothia fuscella TaxID=1048955 RepID=A0A9P4NUH8_9PEZI|nr:hypothetical protein EJ08DRAFT_168309 [Tothia fuscella]